MESDLGYRPISDFQRPGCDGTVAKLLFDRNEQRRERLINQVVETRNEVIKEKESQDIERTPILQPIQTPRKTNHSETIRRLVISKLRDMFRREMHQEAVERTRSISEAYETRRLSVQRSRAVVSNLQEFQMLPQILPPVDPSDEMIRQHQKNEAVKRAESAQLLNERLKTVKERSIIQTERIRARRLERITADEQELKRWEEAQNIRSAEMAERAKSKQQRAMTVLQNMHKIQEETRQRKLDRMTESDAIHQDALTMSEQQRASRLAAERERVNSRMQKLRERQELIEEQRQKLRLDMEATLNEVMKQREVKQKEEELRLITKKIDHEEKIEEIRRNAAATSYRTYRQHDKQLKQEAHQRETVSRLRTLDEKERALERRKFEKTRESVLEIMGKTDIPTDKGMLDKLRHTMGITEEEMKQIVEEAQRGLQSHYRASSKVESS